MLKENRRPSLEIRLRSREDEMSQEPRNTMRPPAAASATATSNLTTPTSYLQRHQRELPSDETGSFQLAMS